MSFAAELRNIRVAIIAKPLSDREKIIIVDAIAKTTKLVKDAAGVGLDSIEIETTIVMSPKDLDIFGKFLNMLQINFSGCDVHSKVISVTTYSEIGHIVLRQSAFVVKW